MAAKANFIPLRRKDAHRNYGVLALARFAQLTGDIKYRQADLIRHMLVNEDGEVTRWGIENIPGKRVKARRLIRHVDGARMMGLYASLEMWSEEKGRWIPMLEFADTSTDFTNDWWRGTVFGEFEAIVAEDFGFPHNILICPKTLGFESAPVIVKHGRIVPEEIYEF